MCLLFLKYDPDCDDDEYLLVFVMTRDEFCSRPTKKCCWWPDDSDVIGGIDLEPGREGGTWLALNRKTAKIGALLNILQPINLIDKSLKGRGQLVSDFVKGSTDGLEYLTKLKENASDFSPFSMVTLDLAVQGEDANKIFQYHNVDGAEPVSLNPGIHAFGNNGAGKPWKKLLYAKEEFRKIVHEHSKLLEKDSLVESVLEMLNDRTKHFPDENLEKQADLRGTKVAMELSSVNVCMEEHNYGSRCKTIILVDKKGGAELIEKTMKDGCDCSRPEWDFSRFQFQIELE